MAAEYVVWLGGAVPRALLDQQFLGAFIGKMFLTLYFVLSACTTAPKSTNDPKIEIISLSEEFRRFWNLAQNESTDRQLKLWDDVVERPHQVFYDSVVWEKKTRPHWIDLKRRLLTEQFKRYGLLYSQIMERFASFPEVTKTEFSRFAERFPDAKLDFPVYAAPSPTFNAKGAVLDSQKIILAFGIDTFLVIHDKYSIVYPHELFHVYHARQSGFVNDGVMENVPITVPLWAEGMAVYVSSLFNESATDADLLEDDALGRVPKSKIPILARLFLKEADAKAIDSVRPEIFKKWFSISTEKISPDLPSRCGYLLGLHVARQIAKTSSLKEMAAWKPDEAQTHVLKTLADLAKK